MKFAIHSLTLSAPVALLGAALLAGPSLAQGASNSGAAHGALPAGSTTLGQQLSQSGGNNGTTVNPGTGQAGKSQGMDMNKTVQPTGAATGTGTGTASGTTMPDNHGNKSPAASNATSSRPETVEQRISMLHDQLKITPAEEGKWKAVASAMRDNANHMDQLVQQRRAHEGDNMTAVDDMKNYQAFADAHAKGLKKVTTAFENLYNAMPADQKKVADAAFQKYGRE